MLRLGYVVGAKVEIVDLPMGPEMNTLLATKAEEFRAAGRRPYFWEPKQGRPIAAVSYLLCMAEIAEEIRAQGVKPSAIYISRSEERRVGKESKYSVWTEADKD